MPRPLREEVAGGIYHVTARGNDRRVVFRDSRDGELYLSMLARVVNRQGWLCLSYCLMHNHVHLLIETPRPNLSNGMQRLQGDYARRFHARHGTSGHLWQGRFHSKRVRHDAQFFAVARYVARNPVEAQLCDHAEEWRWSSHGGVVADAAPAWVDRTRLLHYFTSGSGDPVARYAELVHAA
jgi:REP element-mobilizing transposase RayT